MTKPGLYQTLNDGRILFHHRSVPSEIFPCKARLQLSHAGRGPLPFLVVCVCVCAGAKQFTHAPMSDTSVSLHQLPEYCWGRILLHFDLHEILNLRLVSLRFFAFINSCIIRLDLRKAALHRFPSATLDQVHMMCGGTGRGGARR